MKLLCRDLKNIVMSGLLLAGISASAVNIIKNGDFTKNNENRIPTDWKLASPKNMIMKVVDGGYDSPKALLCKTETLYGGGRAALRQFLPLISNRKYEISCFSQGKAGGYLSFAIGNRWQQRVWIRGGKDWEKYIQTITCKPDQFSWKNAYEICLLMEAKCNAKVSNICLQPLNAFYSVEQPYSKHDGLYVVNKLNSFSLNSNSIPSSLPVIAPELVNKPGMGLGKDSIVKNAADLSCKVALATDSKGLIFYAKVTDNKHYAYSDSNMWNADCVQLGIDQKCERGEMRNNSCDHEIGFSLANGQAHNFDWILKRKLTSKEMQYTVKPISGGYLVIARISWEFLSEVDRDGTGRLSVNVVVNDTDDGIQRKALSLAPGLYSNKSNKANVVCLLNKSKSDVIFLPDTTVITDRLSGRLILTGAAESADYSMQVIMPSGKTIKLDLPKDRVLNNGLPMVADIRINGGQFEAGQSKIQVISGGQVKLETVVTKKDYFNDLKKELPSTQKRYEALKKNINELTEQRKATARMKVACAIAERQFHEFKDMLHRAAVSQKAADYNGRIGLRICKELNMIFDKIDQDIVKARNGAGLPDVPRYKSSPRTLRNGYFEATVVDANGKMSTRPVIFSGYGHFGQVMRDVDWFQNIGVNFIQTELGPNSVIIGERNDGSFILDHKILDQKCDTIKRAKANNVAVCLLISPHYYPEWALKKHPESAWNSGSFLRYDVQDPYAKKLIGAYIKEVISYVRKSPGAEAVHSICISNEPKLTISLKRKQVRERFITYLTRKYRNITALNSAWRRSYASFNAAVPDNSDPTFKVNPGLFYDFTKFKLQEFADWHSWMAQLVKQEWPEMPVHAKVMTAFGIPCAIDYEAFSKFCDLNGTDASESFTQGMMASMKPVHIVNSENHIIPDGHQELVPYDKIYQTMIRQFVDGVGGSAVWVWEPYSLQMFEQRHGLDGNIYRRPLDILAVYDATEAANRLIDDIGYGFNVKPEVALLYSQASAIDNSKYETNCRKVWDLLRHTGRKVGFISEDQLRQNKYNGCKLIFAVNTTNINPSTVTALNRFIKKGGKIITIGKSFLANQYGARLKNKVKTSDRISGKSMKKTSKLLNKLETIIDATVGKLPVSLTILDGTVDSINWRCTPTKDGSHMIYVENIGKDDVKIKLSDKPTDMISGKELPDTFTLPPWGSKLMKL